MRKFKFDWKWTFSFFILAIIYPFTASCQEIYSGPISDMTNHTKVSPAFKTIKNSFSQGNLIGVGYRHYESDYFYVGGAFYTGELSQGAIGSFSDGGIITGYQWSVGKKINFVLENLLGGGGGYATTNAVNTNGAGLITEPMFGIDILLGKRSRAFVDVGYLYMPSSTSWSGGTVEIRIDFLD